MTDTYPRRALTSGSYGGLSLFITMDEKDIDPICNYDIQGMEVSTFTALKDLGS